MESLILQKGLDDAILRAKSYLDAGANGIMIHSRQKEPDEIFEFADSFRQEFDDVPLVCVPTSYNHVSESELENAGFNVVETTKSGDTLGRAHYNEWYLINKDGKISFWFNTKANR